MRRERLSTVTMKGDATYLLVLYLEEQERSPPVPPGRVAKRLDRSPSATTEMLQRLEERGLLTYEPYEGATLTAEGRDRGADLARTYRIMSRFFREVLELEEYEEEARALVGTVSPTVAERLAATLLGGHEGSPTASDA